MAGIYGITNNIDTEQSQLLVNGYYQQKPITVASGEGALTRGRILEYNATTTKYEALTVDPGTTARCILLETIDATAADVETVAVFTGLVNYDDIVFTASTAALKQAALLALQDRGLIVNIDFTDIVATT